LLVITYNFLQFYNPSSIQARRFFLELAENGHQITVLTNKEKNTIEFQHKNIEVIEIFSIKKKFGFKLASILRFRELNFMPDWDLFFWNPFVWLKLMSFKKDRFDFIHTVSSPSSSNLIPLLWKHKGNTKWIAQFYDPWVDNSYINLRFNFFKKLNLRLEKLVAENADLVIHTNSFMVSKWENRYDKNSKNKNLVLPLCMENNIENKITIGSKSPVKEKFILSHVGSIYEKRNLNSLIAALQIIFDAENNILDDLIIYLVGSIDRDTILKIESLGFRNIFRLVGKVSFEESLFYMGQSSLLLLIFYYLLSTYFCFRCYLMMILETKEFSPRIRVVLLRLPFCFRQARRKKWKRRRQNSTRKNPCIRPSILRIEQST
jgi:glycosyltransferase involved in cell wall biosynthesis